jgi:Transposase IS4
MDLRRSPRKPAPKTIWEENGAPSAAKDPKIAKQTARTAKETALKPVVVGHLPETIELDEKSPPELPTYNPPLELEFTPSESLVTGLSEIETFQQLLTPVIVDRLVATTNSYAFNARVNEEPDPKAKPWKPVTSTEIWRYIGFLLHMRRHKETNRDEHWSETVSHISANLRPVGFSLARLLPALFAFVILCLFATCSTHSYFLLERD